MSQRLEMSRVLFAILFLVIVHPSSPTAIAQDYDDEPPEFLPGLITTYAANGTAAVLVESQVAKDWRVETLDERFDSSQPIAIRWEGLLQVRSDGPFTFSVFTNAKIRLRVDEVDLLQTDASPRGEATWLHSQPTTLDYGRQKFEFEFEATHPDQSVVKLYWSDPSFQLEPITDRFFSHDYDNRIMDAFDRGRVLARSYRCAACHHYPGAEKSKDDLLAIPDLQHVQKTVRPNWLLNHLTRKTAQGDDESTDGGRRMPFYGLEEADAKNLVAWLFQHSEELGAAPQVEQELAAEQKANQRKPKKQRPPELSQTAKSRVQRGALLFAATGCIACHQLGQLGPPQNYGEAAFAGGDLSNIADKRTDDFFLRWLSDPGSVNANHRMPKFDLSNQEIVDLAAFLRSQSRKNAPSEVDEQLDWTTALERDRLLGLGCVNCHHVPGFDSSVTDNLTVQRSKIDASSNWTDAGNTCLGAPNPKQDLPGFQLKPADRQALKTFVTQSRDVRRDGADLLAESNCTACHRRGIGAGISRHLPSIAEAHPELASELAALNPPAITGIGDKLHRNALEDAILRRSERLRPWLKVRMPKYEFRADELSMLAEFLIAQDRIPAIPAEASPPTLQGTVAQQAASRLVTSAGFGCQSCHAIGAMETPQVDLKARGTNLAMLGTRIRPEWFDRWVRDPSRIVARMEMPGIQLPAQGLLNNDLDLQLHALWETLNQPDFRPPRPGAVRVVRSHNQPGFAEPTKVVTNVIESTSVAQEGRPATSESDSVRFIRPLLFGLPNRHNVLFDCETASFPAWWLGDTASQHTRGKTWFWEPGAESLVEGGLVDFRLRDTAGKLWAPDINRQVAFRLDALTHLENGIRWQGRIAFLPVEQPATVDQVTEFQFSFELQGPPDSNSVELSVESQLPVGWQLLVQWGSTAGAPEVVRVEQSEKSSANQAVHVPFGRHAHLQLEGLGLLQQDQRTWAPQNAAWKAQLTTSLPGDSFPTADNENVVGTKWPSSSFDSVPGFEATRLPLSPFEMPISFAWAPANSPHAGQLFAGSLKGRVFQVLDTDGDGLEDRYVPISDEIPAPYGLHYSSEGLDVLAKYALLRLRPAATENSPWDTQTVADGWGMTEDYHDWAVGIETDPEGNYYIALPCQQDERDLVDALYRGQALRLVPANSASDGARRAFRLETISAGLRFPMGLVRTKSGELFATDNQGNYNPFNELNHLQEGKRYGFINKLENRNGFSPAFESPAINLPHPWTRSVNGICELATPAHLADRDTPLFGPFEGHLLGCEMNGRSLIRMSLQNVNGQLQGAAYLFSKPPSAGEQDLDGFEGPIVCEIAPSGEIYVGNLHDSGWGGGQNTGSIVRLRKRGLDLGIAEVRATTDGFEIDFTKPIDPALASELTNYQVRSYRRVSTPAYGGDDQDERTESVESVQVSPDGNRVVLRLANLRAGFVYELNLGDIGPDNQPLFPRQAHYTMRSVPK